MAIRSLVRRKSESKGVQKEHTRRIMTMQGVRPVIVNPGVKPVHRPMKFKRFTIRPEKIRVTKREAPRIKIKPVDEVGGQIPRFSVGDQTRKMALIYYFIDAHNRLKDMDRETMLEVAKEISHITGIIPIWYVEDEYKGGEIKRAIGIAKKDFGIKYLGSAPTKNRFTIRGVPKEFTPLHLTGIYYYLMDRLSGGQLDGMAGFEYLKTAKAAILKKEAGI